MNVINETEENLKYFLIRLQSYFYISNKGDLDKNEINILAKAFAKIADGKMTSQQVEINLKCELGDEYKKIFQTDDDMRELMNTVIGQLRGMSQLASSEDPIFKMANPAWRLTRVGYREQPREDWAERWKAAGESVGWRGAIESQSDFIALKDSPIWEALGNGVGGFDDALRCEYPPFAFGSGLGWVNIGKRETIKAGLME